MPYTDQSRRREYQRNWVAARRAEYLAGKRCKHCGSAERIEIHHRDPSEKEDNSIWSWSRERLEAELAKCDYLCYWCHKAEHQRLWALQRKHGMIRTYRRGCRCQKCKAANAQDKRNWRQRVRIGAMAD